MPVNGFMGVVTNLGQWIIWKLMGESSVSRLDDLLISLDFEFSYFMKCILQKSERLYSAFQSCLQYPFIIPGAIRDWPLVTCCVPVPFIYSRALLYIYHHYQYMIMKQWYTLYVLPCSYNIVCNMTKVNLSEAHLNNIFPSQSKFYGHLILLSPCSPIDPSFYEHGT